MKFVGAFSSAYGVSPSHDQGPVRYEFDQSDSKSSQQKNSKGTSSSFDDSSDLADSFDSEAQRAFCDPDKPQHT